MAVVEADREVREAARAVAHALRPAHAEAITRLHGDPEDAIATSMRENWHTDRTVAFWSATGPGLTAAMTTVTGADEGLASFLVGAALHAALLGRQDTAPDAILRLAERAACWDAGRRWVVDKLV